MFLATFDQRLHTMEGTPDTAQLIKDTYKEIVGIDTIPGTNFAAIFGHLGGFKLKKLTRYQILTKIFEQLDTTLSITVTCGQKSTVRICFSQG